MLDPCPCRIFCLLVMVASLTSPGLAQSDSDTKAINLRPRFKVGQTTEYELWSRRTQKMDQTLDNQSHTVTATYDVTGKVTWIVQEVQDDGSARCQMTFDWLAIDITLPDGQTKHYDTRETDASDDPPAQIFNAMVGQPFVCIVEADGSISQVQGTDVIRENAGDNAHIPSDLDFIETASDLATLPFAPATISPGGTWNALFEWTHEMGMMKHDVTFTLDHLETIAGIDVAVVTAEGDLTLTVDEKKIEKAPVPIDVQLLEGTISHQILFDLTRHEAVGRNVVQKTTLQTQLTLGSHTMSQTVHETIQSQVLRVRESNASSDTE